MKQKIQIMLLIVYGFMFSVYSAVALANSTIHPLATEQLTDFPNVTPNADISIQRSAFGAERVKAACFGTGEDVVVNYRIFKKYYKKRNDKFFFEVSNLQTDKDFV